MPSRFWATNRWPHTGKRLTLLLLGIPMLMLLLGSCHSAGRNAMYYWRTTFRLDSVERTFIQQHNIGRLYVKFFDVVADGQGYVVPTATTVFADSVPDDIEVVPTVFIMENCLRADTAQLAQKLVRRILQMSETNNVGNIREVQIDCDWTRRSMDAFYRLAGQIRASLRQRGIALSVTVRLHQLSMPTPPADRGVLMLYNTGDVTKRSERNPILDMRDVAPYLSRLRAYALPLAAAYPIFDWDVLFHHQQFRHIAYNKTDAQCKLIGDTLIHWHCTADDIMQVRRAVQKVRGDINDETILYHLDRKLIDHYNKEDYEKILHQ